MATVVTPEALYFGAPVSLLIDGVEMGATLDNPVVNFEIEKYAPRFRNAGGPVVGAAVTKSVIPSLECRVNELSAAKIAHAMPGSTSTVGTAAETAGGGDTTLDGDVAAGATEIEVADATGIAAGNFLRIGDAGETEIHKVAVGGVTGTTITLTTPLVRAHDDGDAVREVDDAGTTLITWTVGRVPSASFIDVEAIGQGLDGREMRVLIKNALAGDSFQFTMGDDDFYGVPLKFTGNYADDAPRVVPFELELG